MIDPMVLPLHGAALEGSREALQPLNPGDFVWPLYGRFPYAFHTGVVAWKGLESRGIHTSG
jgi:hypothetical protein